jgi:hypothetical protein
MFQFQYQARAMNIQRKGTFVPAYDMKAYKGSSHSDCFSPGKDPSSPLNRRVWVPDPVWTFRRGEKSLPPAGIRTAPRPSCSLVTIPTTLSRLQSLWLNLESAPSVAVTSYTKFPPNKARCMTCGWTRRRTNQP